MTPGAHKKKYRATLHGKAVERRYEQSKACKAIRKRYRQSKAGKLTRRHWRYSKAGRLYFKRYHHLKNHGVSLEIRQDILAAQGGVCAICKTDKPGKKGWQTDHDHLTGRIRGVLCFRCNIGLGHFNDNKELLQEAILYLGRP